jgi:hypothetical protein
MKERRLRMHEGLREFRRKEEKKEDVSMSNLAQKHEAAYTLEQLATDMETVVAQEREHARIVAAAEPLLARKIAANGPIAGHLWKNARLDTEEDRNYRIVNFYP